MSAETKVIHNLVRIPYQFSLPSEDYLDTAPRGYLRQDGTRHGIIPGGEFEIPYAPIPTPIIKNGQIDFRGGDFGLWFTSFVSSFNEYLNTPDNSEPTIFITKDVNHAHYVQVLPLTGKDTTAYFYPTSIPKGQEIVMDIHGHAINSKKKSSVIYPSSTDVEHACFDRWSTSVVIDTEGVTVMAKGPEFYSNLLHFLNNNGIPINKVDKSVLWLFIDAQDKTIVENHPTPVFTSERRFHTLFACSLFGLHLLRLTPSANSGVMDCEIIYTPKMIPTCSNKNIQRLKEKINSLFV
jgi:hypothetical protein